jgi:pimeloyl-ACP methyl ester carboxylesterase
MEAVLLLSDIAAGAGDSLLKRVTETPQRSHAGSGDLYRPADGVRAAMVLLPGAARTGKDDPRLVALANSLARSGWLVLVPEIPGLRSLQVSAADAALVAEAVRSLERPRVAVAAISFAAGPAVLAALEPDIASRVGLVVAVGPPFDLTAVTTFFTTGAYREAPGAPWRHLEPNAYGKWVFVKSNAARLDDAADRTLLAAIAERRMADERAPLDDLRRGLTPQGRAVMALMDNSDPERVPDLIAALPRAIREEMERLDLSRRDLSRLRARLLVVYGRDDRIIPWTEGAALARAVPVGDLILLDGLAHADLGAGSGLGLWRVAERLLAFRDGVT